MYLLEFIGKDSMKLLVVSQLLIHEQTRLECNTTSCDCDGFQAAFQGSFCETCSWNGLFGRPTMGSHPVPSGSILVHGSPQKTQALL